MSGPDFWLLHLNKASAMMTKFLQILKQKLWFEEGGPTLSKDHRSIALLYASTETITKRTVSDLGCWCQNWHTLHKPYFCPGGRSQKISFYYKLPCTENETIVPRSLPHWTLQKHTIGYYSLNFTPYQPEWALSHASSTSKESSTHPEPRE